MKKKIGRILLFCCLISFAFLVRHYLLNPITVQGDSMEPTLENSQRLWQTSLTKMVRFDLITFSSPRNGKRLIKRIIGLPGDTIEYKNDQLYINGQLFLEPYLKSLKQKITDNQPLTADFSLTSLSITNTNQVPEGYVFVLGDNRRVADDSRYFGFVPKSSIYGVAYFRFYPLNESGPV